METLDYILKKFNITYNGEPCIYIPNFGRNDLAKLFEELDFNFGVEVGVEEGVYSDILLNANPKLLLASIDAWEFHRAYRDHTNQSKLDKFYENTQKRLRHHGIYAKIVKKFSMDAVKDFKDRSLDFVYIDANHKFVEVANDIHHWAKKVRRGGIVAGHDFTKYKDLEVEIHPAMVVPAFCEAYKIRPYFVIGENVDPVKSWFFVQSLK